jgi:hypothetical protein
MSAPEIFKKNFGESRKEEANSGELPRKVGFAFSVGRCARKG